MLTHHVKTFETLGECEACRNTIVYTRSDDCVITVRQQLAKTTGC